MVWKAVPPSSSRPATDGEALDAGGTQARWDSIGKFGEADEMIQRTRGPDS